jgi:nucleoside-diphosphate-sugar epimerase
LISERDVEQISTYSAQFIEAAQDQTIVITGGTGFVGRWLVESLLRCGAQSPRLILIVRSKNKAQSQLQGIKGAEKVKYIEQDISNKLKIDEPVHQIWHLATSSAVPSTPNASHIIDSSLRGTFRLLDLAAGQTEPPKFMHTSSGAVYGRGLKPGLEITEDLRVANDWLKDAEVYDASKRATEMILKEATKDGVVSAKNARLFAFVGPYLPIDSHFAIGNFIRAAIESKPITLTSSGVDFRSYLYAADLISWLFAYMHSDYTEPLNVGSDQSISIRECAELVASIAKLDVKIDLGDTHEPTKYVPNIDRARNVLGLDVYTDLKDSIERTIEWHLAQSKVK